MNKLNGKEINMDSFEDFVAQIGLDGIMKGKSPEFYNNLAQALGGLLMWNILDSYVDAHLSTFPSKQLESSVEIDSLGVKAD